MANKKISALDSLGGTPDVADIIPITDVSDTTGSVNGTTKKVTVAEMISAVSIDGTAVTSTGETGASKFLREDGDGTCSFQTVPITDENLRGTDNPHMGAFSNQSFLVVDNPSKSVMLGSDTDEKLYLITSSGRAAIATGISVVEDSSEPDIEMTTSTGTYSLISGDSDTKDANNLPAQQGFNAPDIGAFSSPLLISGGSIA